MKCASQSFFVWQVRYDGSSSPLNKYPCLSLSELYFIMVMSIVYIKRITHLVAHFPGKI